MSDQTKKILMIIGTTLGVVSSIIGIIAVFFPDLFNLSKKIMPEYSAVIVEQNEMNDFEKFLDYNSGEIAKIRLEICNNDYWVDNINVNESKIKIAKSTFNIDGIYWERFLECDLKIKGFQSDYPGGFIVDGYYFLQPSRFNFREGNIYVLEKVDDRQLRMRDY